MPKRYRPREVIRVLESLGWQQVRRQRGSHVNLRMSGNPNVVTVPTSDREVNIGTFSNIKRRAGISNAEFDRIADEVL